MTFKDLMGVLENEISNLKIVARGAERDSPLAEHTADAVDTIRMMLDEVHTRLWALEHPEKT